MPNVSQEEYSRVIRTIAENSSYQFMRRDSESGAFLIPTDGHGHPVGDIFHLPWRRLRAFAKTLLEARPIVDRMLEGTQGTRGRIQEVEHGSKDRDRDQRPQGLD